MGCKRWRRIFVLFAAIFLFGCSDEIKLADEDMHEVRESLLSAAESVQTRPDKDAVFLITPGRGEEIAEKKQENEDAIGWLIVPDTHIDDVILQNPENNNSYYTTHDFYKKSSRTAAYGTDWRCDFSSGFREDIPNNIALYGHSYGEDPNGDLFSPMKKFKDPDFAREHPYVFFSTEDEDMAWEVFAVFVSSVDLPYIIPNMDWDEFSNVLDVVYEASIYDYGIEITEDDKILSISCCSYEVPGREELLPFDTIPTYRFVVMARLVEPDGQIKEEASFTINENPLTPDEMPTIYHSGNDLFMYDGFIWYNVSKSERYENLDLSDGIPIGEIEQTGIILDLQEWDAISLEVGTQILRHPTNDKILIAIVDGLATPYLKYE